MLPAATVSLVLCLLPAATGAQQALDPSRMVPIRAQPKHAGTVDVTTGRWTRPAEAQVQKTFGSLPIYRNTCTWQAAGYYGGSEPCEDNYDEGRVPSSSDPSGPLGASSFHKIESFEVSYCTQAGDVSGAGGYDMDVAFFDNLGGACVGGVAPTPPPISSSAKAYFSLAGLGLPGSTAAGFQACWIVEFNVSNTGWFMEADGDGSFDDDPALDLFTWMQRQNTFASPLGYPSATPDGFLIAGEPMSGAFGSCSYLIPCGTDALFGNSCGTGLDTFDNHWINVDGIAAGDTSGATPTGCPNAISQYGFGTNCYFFGGYPSNPYASYWLTLRAVGGDLGACGQTNSCGRSPVVTQTTTTPGQYTLNSGDVWTVIGHTVPAAPNPGILVYGNGGILSSPINVPFGLLCISPFFRATSTLVFPDSTVGGCSQLSQYTWDFGAFADANAGTNGLVAGNSINIQGWHRDPNNVGTANFTGVTSTVTLQ